MYILSGSSIRKSQQLEQRSSISNSLLSSTHMKIVHNSPDQQLAKSIMNSDQTNPVLNQPQLAAVAESSMRPLNASKVDSYLLNFGTLSQANAPSTTAKFQAGDRETTIAYGSHAATPAKSKETLEQKWAVQP